MKKIGLVLGTLLLLSILVSCQQVFTYSVLDALGLQRDVSTLPPEQQIAYAESALASGDVDAMTEAYAVISALLAETTAEDDPELYMLGAELAIGASGLVETMTEALTAMAEGGDLSGFTEFEDSTLEMLGDAVDYIQALDNSTVTVPPDLYVNGAVALLIIAMDDAGGIENLDFENPSEELALAMEWADLGEVTLETYFGG